jgi:hypothetical protein
MPERPSAISDDKTLKTPATPMPKPALNVPARLPNAAP